MVEQAYKNLKGYQSYQVDSIIKYNNVDIKDEKLIVTLTLTNKGQTKLMVKDEIFYNLNASILNESNREDMYNIAMDYELVKRKMMKLVTYLLNKNDKQAYLISYSHRK